MSVGSKIVGFITDFGLSDPYVGQVKGVMLSLNPGLRIVDLGHLIEPFCVTCGAYVVYSSYKFLPTGSGLLAVVDPGVGSDRRALIAEAFDRVFVGPDNGILWQVLSEDPSSKIYTISEDAIKLDWERSSTFHGRDLFGPAMAMALKYGVDHVAGERVDRETLVRLELRWVQVTDGGHCFRVVYIDRFGNIALSATLRDYTLPPMGSEARIVVRGVERRVRVLPSFSHAEKGGIVAYFNSFGFLEIAVNQGSASRLLNVGVGDRICLRT